MKLLLTYRSDRSEQNGWFWWDPFHNDAHAGGASYANLSTIVELAGVTELRSENVLDRLTLDEGARSVAHWVDLLAHGGEITLMVTDFDAVARGFVKGELGMDYVNSRLVERKSIHTLDGLVTVLRNRQLKIVKARVEGTLAVVVARRN